MWASELEAANCRPSMRWCLAIVFTPSAADDGNHRHKKLTMRYAYHNRTERCGGLNCELSCSHGIEHEVVQGQAAKGE